MGKPFVRFCEGWRHNRCMAEILWHRRETRRQTENTNIMPIARKASFYSTNIRTRFPTGGYTSTTAPASRCLLPPYHGYSPPIGTVKTAGERAWTGNTY